MTEYEEAAEESLKELYWQPMKILIWGPGKPGSTSTAAARKRYQKRLDIRNVLRQLFKRSDVNFPEDRSIRKLVKRIRSERDKSLFIADMSDLIISLDMSRGADAEIDDFLPNFPGIKEKVCVLIRKKYLNSSSYVVNAIFEGLPDKHLIGFSDYSYNKCNLATKTVPEIALSAAIRKKLG